MISKIEIHSNDLHNMKGSDFRTVFFYWFLMEMEYILLFFVEE